MATIRNEAAFGLALRKEQLRLAGVGVVSADDPATAEAKAERERAERQKLMEKWARQNHARVMLARPIIR